jgi:hypothetical protein
MKFRRLMRCVRVDNNNNNNNNNNMQAGGGGEEARTLQHAPAPARPSGITVAAAAAVAAVVTGAFAAGRQQ